MKMLQPSQFVVCKEHQDGVEIQVLNPDGEVVSWPDGAQSYVLPIPMEVLANNHGIFLDVLADSHGVGIWLLAAEEGSVSFSVSELLECLHVEGTDEKILFMDSFVCNLTNEGLMKLRVHDEVLDSIGHPKGYSYVGKDERCVRWPIGDNKRIAGFLANEEYFRAYMEMVGISHGLPVEFVEDSWGLDCFFGKSPNRQ